MRINRIVTLEMIERMANPLGKDKYSKVRLVYGSNTCWWMIGDPIYTLSDGSHLPCGPRGEMLFETDDAWAFIETAKSNPSHYGKHGLDAFVAAYHGNLVTDDGKPTSFETWNQYNHLLDREDVFK